MIKKYVVLFLKGIFIGFGTIIPGISGGTAAIIVGCFQTMLDAVANLHRHIKESIKILLPLITGVIIGIIAFSMPLDLFCSTFPKASKTVFCITAILGMIMFIKTTILGSFSFLNLIFVFIGAFIAFIISCTMYAFEINVNVHSSLLLYFVSLSLALALILPAISFSYMLLFLGLYDKTLNAITEINIRYLTIMGLGLITGIFIFSKMLLKLINKFPAYTYSFVLGFVIFSVVDILL